MIRRLRRDDAGVSSVVGSVLTLALLVTVLGVVTVQWVPSWEKDREAEHMIRVQNALLALKSDAERQAAHSLGGSPVSTAVPLIVEHGGLRSVTGGTLPAGLAFESGAGAAARFTSAELLVFRENGAPMFGMHEHWVPITTGARVEAIDSVQHLRLRLDAPHLVAALLPTVTLTVLDRDDHFAGDLLLRVRDHPSGYSVTIAVRDDAGQRLHEETQSHFTPPEPSPYWVNALSADLPFAGVLETARAPFTLTLATTGLTGSYAMSHLTDTPLGLVPVGGSGRMDLEWEHELETGSLQYTSLSRRMPAQTLHLEHGALLLEQPDGTTMLSPPHFEVARLGDRTEIALTAIGLIGDLQPAQPALAAPVALDPSLRTSLKASAPELHWDLPTAFPDTWASFWRARLVAAGLDEAAGHFRVTPGEASVRLDILGTSSDPGAHDLLLQLHLATLRVGLPN